MALEFKHADLKIVSDIDEAVTKISADLVNKMEGTTDSLIFISYMLKHTELDIEMIKFKFEIECYIKNYHLRVKRKDVEQKKRIELMFAQFCEKWGVYNE